ncbi:MAG: ChbG/HpnK family deacetylase [Chitinophagaceae bacterium]|nr:MAG: ChbG/HpnK family deacetylase [Chitinophagaceae bacterium]
MKYLMLPLLIGFSMTARSQRLIVRGDDMGYSHSGNLALIDCYKNGIQKSIEVIVPSPWFPEAVKLLKQNPGVDIGIHLALTSEWENVKWRPMSDCPSLTDSNGYFYPMVNPNPNYPGQSIKENKWNITDIEKEFRAQIELALKLLPGLSHVSSHMGCTWLSPEVTELTNKLAAEYKIRVDPQPKDLNYVGYDGPHKTPEEKIASFASMLNKLEKGKTYLFLDHPGLDDPELRAIYHIGYEDVSADRQGVTDLFTNKTISELIKKKGIQLISYADLVKK